MLMLMTQIIVNRHSLIVVRSLSAIFVTGHIGRANFSCGLFTIFNSTFFVAPSATDIYI
jgi:hypothetical protein